MSTICAIILARDEEEMLPGCLRRLAFVDEVLVAVDSRSTDRTVAIAQEAGAHVVVLDFHDFASARRAAQQAAQADWILSVDADERISAGLAREIQLRTCDASPNTVAFRIPRRNYFYGQQMRHGGWVNEAPTRLFRRTAVSVCGQVHESTRMVEPGRTEALHSPLIHFSHRSVEQSLEKDWLYADLGAKQLLEDGAAPVTTSRIVKRAAWQFLRRCVVKRAWRDGPVGVVEVFRVLGGDLTTQLRLWELQRKYDPASTYRQLDFEIDVPPAHPPLRPVVHGCTQNCSNVPKPVVSVCLCSCDGERFLAQQLTSLSTQTRPPDELIVVDDASCDRTMDILEDFALSAPFRVKITAHGDHHGLRESLAESLAAARGDFLFPSKQDDLWLDNKIERLTTELQRRPTAAGVFCNSRFIDSLDQQLGTTMWDQVGFSARERHQLSVGNGLPVLLRHESGVPASSLAFRSERLASILPLTPYSSHLTWPAWVLVVTGDLYAVDECLDQYRQPETDLGFDWDQPTINRLLHRPDGPVDAFELSCVLKDLLERISRDSIGCPDVARGLIAKRIQLLEFLNSLPPGYVARLGALAKGFCEGTCPMTRDGFMAVAAQLAKDWTPPHRRIGAHL
jgi:glycosyltransferase involved in cell wall biosynthesis